ncbi:MAG: hypothetical protein M4579_006117 [Chaenotheca gracillima]|nr:MAG: hypothetical protein M4579_006117 [Chaenotheca gracillima]
MFFPGGINIAGFDFGCSTDGSCTQAEGLENNIPDGAGQMQHFVQDDKFNAFRLPVGWQYLVNNQLGGPLAQPALGQYDELVQSCIKVAEMCIIDIHNYARWDGQIIGQGGPTDDQFVNLWTQLATKYASASNVAFGVMNEPHDLPSVETWATTVGKVVAAIRQAGATSQYILLPGNGYTSAGAFVSGGSAAALEGIKDSDGTTDRLIFDVHQYLDDDSSGTSTVCVTDQIESAFQPLADHLRGTMRKAFLSEFGGANNEGCQTDACNLLSFLNDNSDVYLGWTSWAAGGFDASYTLTETPTNNGGSWTDTSMVTQCMVPMFGGGGGGGTPPPSTGNTKTSTTPSATSGTPPSGSSAVPAGAQSSVVPVGATTMSNTEPVSQDQTDGNASNAGKGAGQGAGAVPVSPPPPAQSTPAAAGAQPSPAPASGQGVPSTIPGSTNPHEVPAWAQDLGIPDWYFTQTWKRNARIFRA